MSSELRNPASGSPDAMTYLRKAVGGIELLFAGPIDLASYNRTQPVELRVRTANELLDRLCARVTGQIQMAADLGLIDRSQALSLQAEVEELGKTHHHHGD